MSDFSYMLQFVLREGTLLALLFFAVSMFIALLQQSVGQRVNAALAHTSLGIGTALAATAGAVTPFCSCSTVPILTGMLRANIRFGICFTFLIASPVINEGVLLVLLRQYSPTDAAVFLAAAFSLSVAFGVAVDRLGMGQFVKLAADANMGDAIQVGTSHTATVPLRAKLRFATLTAVNELRSAAPHLLIGVSVGSLIYGYVPQDAIADLQSQFPSVLLIFILALAGVPFYVNATMVVPIALALLLKGLTIGPVVAFLVSGAGTSIPEMILLTRLFTLPLMLSHFIAILVSATLIGLVLEWTVHFI